MASREEIEYAAELTETVLEPQQTLETFGATVVNYHLVSELLDEVGKVRIRKGKIHVERPQVITPRYYANELVENFGEDAKEYAEQFADSPEGTRIIRYGLQFRKQEHDQTTVDGNISEVAERLADDLKNRGDNFSGVIIGVDDLWEISLLRFAIEVIGSSAPRQVKELSDKGLLQGTSNDVPAAVRTEIESDFREAAGDRDKIHALGNKLRKHGLLEEYEDRFFQLVRALKS